MVNIGVKKIKMQAFKCVFNGLDTNLSLAFEHKPLFSSFHFLTCI